MTPEEGVASKTAHRARAVRSLRKDGASEAERPLNRYERRNLKHAIRRTK